MKSIKKLKKYGTAIAGSALLVGATLTGAAAASHSGSSGMNGDLTDYPAPFVDDDGTVQSSIVVGEDAAAADVVGAIDIAGSLSQSAYTSEQVEGASSTTVNGAEEDVDIRADSAGTTIDASDYDQLLRKTVTDSNDEDHFVTESATLEAAGASAQVNGSEVVSSVANNALHYNVNFAPGFEQGETVEMLGNEYEVTGFSSSPNEVTLGSTVTNDQLELDETYSHGPYTVKVEDFNTNDNSVLVQVSKDGSQLKMQGVKTGESFTADNGDLNVTADSIYFGSQGNYISISSTYSDTTITSGETAPMDEDYDVTSVSLANTGDNDESTTTLQGLTLKSTVQTTTSNPADTNDVNDIRRLKAGESISGPADYFSATYQGLTEEATGDIRIRDGPEVTFNDVEGFSHTLDLTSNMMADNFDGVATFDDSSTTATGMGTYYVDVKGHPVKVDVSEGSAQGDGTIAVDVSYQTYSDSFTVDTTVTSETTVLNQQETGYGFTLNVDNTDTVNDQIASLEITSDGTNDNTDNEFHTQLGAELTYDGADFLLAEAGDANGADTLEDYTDSTDQTSAMVTFSSGDVNEVHYETEDGVAYTHGDGNGLNPAITSEDTDGRTTFGSSVRVSGSKSPVTLTVPEEQLNAQYALGSVTSSSSEGGTSKAPAYGDSFPSVGALDSDQNIGQVKENDNVILVGGPAINDLTSELAQENQTWTADEWRNGGHEGTSVLQLTEGFDGEGGNKALVVAGHSAEDTRTASEFLSNYGDHQGALEGKSEVTISTETGNVVQ